MEIDIDTSEVMKLAADISAAGRKIAPFAKAATQVTAGKVKEDARELTSGMTRLGGVPRTIDYTLTEAQFEVGAEIGFNKTGQGNMGHWIEYGSSRFSARGPLSQALFQNQDDYLNGLTRAATDALGGLG